LLTFWYLLQMIYSNTLPKKNKKIKRADQILTEVYGTTLSNRQWINKRKTFKPYDNALK
jgi:hypothetical protein